MKCTKQFKIFVNVNWCETFEVGGVLSLQQATLVYMFNLAFSSSFKLEFDSVYPK